MLRQPSRVPSRAPTLVLLAVVPPPYAVVHGAALREVVEPMTFRPAHLARDDPAPIRSRLHLYSGRLHLFRLENQISCKAGIVWCPAENRTRVRLADSEHANMATSGAHEAADFLLSWRRCPFLGPYLASVT